MQNPFESGHIKNYLLLYASVVVIMILFFIASTLFHDVQEMDKKTFNTQESSKSLVESNKSSELDKAEELFDKSKFKLLDKAY